MSRRVGLIAFALAAVVAAHLADGWAYHHLGWPAAGDRDWGRMLRILGFAPTWLVVALVLWVEGRGTPAGRSLTISAEAVALAALIGGLASEVAKLLLRRERPNLTAGLYQFRGFDVDPFNTSPLGLPSGHTMVAFSGAGALAARYPRLGPIVLALAAGCGLTRVFAQAHFLSDVVVGAAGGWWLGAAVARRVGRREATGSR